MDDSGVSLLFVFGFLLLCLIGALGLCYGQQLEDKKKRREWLSNHSKRRRVLERRLANRRLELAYLQDEIDEARALEDRTQDTGITSDGRELV